MKLECENCNETGYYGDNGPGVEGNDEYQFCECQHGIAIQIMKEIGGAEGHGKVVCLIDDYAKAVADHAVAEEKARLIRYEETIEQNNRAIHKLETLIKRLAEALLESNALNINWSSETEAENLEYYSEYRAVIKQGKKVLAAFDEWQSDKVSKSS